MKKVALISDGWKRIITYAWADGIMKFIHESGEEISLYHYNCHGNYSKDELHNQGEYNIFTLSEMEEFDGVILDCINTTDKQQLEKLIQQLKRSKVPVISIGNDIEGFYYAGVDNRKAISEIMHHLYEVHGCRSFVFAGGPKENYENSLRIQAYNEFLLQYGLSQEENPVWHGDYEFSTGVQYFERFLTDGKPFPDAFVCANDNIAAGLCHCAQQNGYSVPEDFRVTGFDNLDKAIYFKPQITTVGHMREIIGYQCIENLVKLWNNEPVPKSLFVPSDCIFTESCGCPNSGLLDYREYVKNQIISGTDKMRQEERQARLEGELVKYKTYEQIVHSIADYFISLDCDACSIVLDKRLYSAEDEKVFPVEGYDIDQLVVAYSTEKKKCLLVKGILELQELMQKEAAGNFFMFTPIHFRERTVGLSILKNPRFLSENPCFYDMHRVIAETMEHLYKKLQLEKANQKLRDTYNRDQLTGLYNRIAYTEMIEPEYQMHLKNYQRCAVAFLDVDCFKEINDTYGHARGDSILKEIARVLTEKCPKNGYVYRFGGDEFISFFPCNGERDAQNFRTEMVETLRRSGISVSMGIAVTEPTEKRNFDEYLRMADQEMYAIKKQKSEIQ